MITFKQFLAEIDHDDEVYSKEASAWTASKVKLDDTWSPLLRIGSDEYVWKEHGPNVKEYMIALKDPDVENGILIRLGLKTMNVKVPGGELTGVITDSLSSHEKIRGKGVALKLYQALVEHGQVLFSASSQTTGSRKLWERLVQSNAGEVFVLAQEAAAQWYANKYKMHEDSGNVLLIGSQKAMNDEAYASEETRWVIVPHNMVRDLKKNAIDLDNK